MSRRGRRLNRRGLATAVASAPAYNPMTALTNGILWSKMDRDVTSGSASLSSGDPANAAWTKTNCTVVATGTGTQCQLTAGGATDAYDSITPTNIATGATCVPATFTIWASYQTIRYLIIETRAATANNRAVFDVQNGVISSLGTGINMQDLTCMAETRNGVAGYRLSCTCWANGAAMIFRVYGSTGTTLTAPGVGTTMLLDDATVSQTYATTVANFVTAANYSAGSIDGRPGYYTDTIVPCIRGFGLQVMYSTEAALVARFAHGAAGPFPSYTYAALCSFRDSDANTAVFGWGLSSTATNHSGYIGQNTTGAGSYIVVARNATTADNVESTDVPDTAVGVIGITYDGTTGTTTIYRNGVAIAGYVGDQTQNLATVTPDRTAIFGRGGSTLSAAGVGDLYEHVMYSDAKSGADMLSLATGLLTRVA